LNVLVLGNEEISQVLKAEGVKITADPGDRIYAAVSTTDRYSVMPENVPVYLKSLDPLSDWTAKKHLPGAVIFTDINEILPQLKELAAEHESIPAKSTQESIMIATYANKGGVGKTTAANGIAVTLARQGINTVICDFDFGGANLASFYSLKKEPLDYFEEPENLSKYLFKVKDNLYLLPAPKNIIPAHIKGIKLEKVLHSLKEMFSVVLCDTCPSPWEKNYMPSVFGKMDMVYAVVNQSKFSVEETKVYAPQLLFMGVKPEDIRIIVNQYDPKLTNLREIEKAFSAGFKKEVKKLPSIIGVIPHNWTEANWAVQKADITAPDVWKKICREILTRLNKISEPEPRTKGFLNIFKRRK
jgi:MinD-like ATPase involved in chromosome partitioning or flagellar assembly